MSIIDILISLILGIMVSIIIKFALMSIPTYHGPNSNEIKNRIYMIDSKCFKLIPEIEEC